MAILCLVCPLLASAAHAEVCPIVRSPAGDVRERWAATELSTFLGRIYPGDDFPVRTTPPAEGRHVLLGTVKNTPALAELVDPIALQPPGAYVVTRAHDGARSIGIVAGSDSRGVLDGVYALLEQKLGHGFYLHTNAAEGVIDEPFSFEHWDIAAHPRHGERIVFNWYNFISGVSAWNLEHYKEWIRQSARMRYTTVMLHAYAWSPLLEFSYNGQTKPVEYLQNTRHGRHWGNLHTPDIRKLAGGNLLDEAGPIFGADAGKIGYGGVTHANRVTHAKALLRAAIDYAANTVGMEFNWAFDVDTVSANPQNVILTLPEKSRFRVGQHWVARPDMPEGYAYYKQIVATMMSDYPGITRLTLWWRADSGTKFDGLVNSMLYEELPKAWKAEYDAAPEAVKGALTPGSRPLGPANLFYAKLADAVRRALDDLGYERVQVGYGTWVKSGPRFSSLLPADHFQHRSHTAYALDYSMAFDGDRSYRDRLKQWSSNRPLVVVEWAHHDDGKYCGRPYTPPTRFADKLAEVGADGFAVIHWTTRPLDVFFKNLQNQVWSDSLNEPYAATCDKMAVNYFGRDQSPVMAEYLADWLTTAPQFGRETKVLGWTGVKDFDRRIADCDRRMAILDRVDTTHLSEAALRRWRYFKGHEEWIQLFHRAQRDWDQDLQRQTIRKFVEKASVNGGMTRGEQGLMLQHSLKWLDPAHHKSEHDEQRVQSTGGTPSP